jgi:hypothetical protein
VKASCLNAERFCESERPFHGVGAIRAPPLSAIFLYGRGAGGGYGSTVRAERADQRPGAGGCYVDAFSPFPLKTGVKLHITSEKRSFEAHAEVVYSKTGMGMGLAFTTVEPEQLQVLDRWLAELSGAAPFEPERGEGNGNSQAKEPSSDEQCYALIERTISLIRQGSLSNEQGKTLLRNLLCPEAKS